MQERIRSIELECISRGKENSASSASLSSSKHLENSRNLPKPEKGHSSDVRGGMQPVTADDTEDSLAMQFCDITDTRDRDWPRGKILEASD